AATRVATLLFYVGERDAGQHLVAAVLAAKDAAGDPTLDDDPWLEGSMRKLRARLALESGQPAAYREHTREGIACYEEIGATRSACLNRTDLGYAAIELGAYEEAERTLRAALADSDRM